MKKVYQIQGNYKEAPQKLEKFINKKKEVEQILFAVQNNLFIYTIICEEDNEE